MTLSIRSWGALVCLGAAGLAGPALAAPTASPSPTSAPAPIVARDLYSMHARRMVQAYLRLRMLEMRESDLDRARAVVEGRLSVNDLFATPGQASDQGRTEKSCPGGNATIGRSR
jgi:hypothetical protein